jgi:phosphoribosylanthranilate isomerase
MTKVKICGIKSLRDALAAAEAGADLLGFNFYLESPRFIDARTCEEISAVLKEKFPSIQLVGVFVNSSREAIETTMAACSLDLAQLHGDETPEFCAALGNRAFKAFRGIPDGRLETYARSVPPAFLVDGVAAGLYGGTGNTADWSAAAKLGRNYPFLLSGGLKPENVAEAVRQVKPWGVDVASGVESRPGEKDPDRIRAFLDAVRSAQIEMEKP